MRKPVLLGGVPGPTARWGLWLGRAVGSSAVALLGQGLMALGAGMGFWAVGKPQGAGQGQSGLVVP